MLTYNGNKDYMNGNYPAICLYGSNHHVHRLEWQKYNGEIPNGFVVHHKNENKLDWNIENLELISRSEHLSKHRNVVKRHGSKVIARKDDVEILFDNIAKAAKCCGTYDACVHRILNGKQKRANGWTFERG